jgi:hypothetical protein
MRARIGRALPRSADLNPAESRLLAAAFVALAAMLVVAAANAVLGIGGATAGPFIRDWISLGRCASTCGGAPLPLWRLR